MTKLPTPLCGKVIIEAADIKKEYGVSTIELPDSVVARHHKGTVKGTVIKMATDSFGDAYERHYGKVEHKPKVGDTVLVLQYQGVVLPDTDGKYHLVSDEDIIAVYE